jgi:hypothetical protein
VAKILPIVLDSYWRKSGTRFVLICKPYAKLLHAINRAVSQEIGVGTCEIWKEDKLMLKAPQSLIKSDVAHLFASDIEHKIGGHVGTDAILQTNAWQLAPDIAWWYVRPPRDRRLYPLRVGNLLKLPNLWIEIADNFGEDVKIATENIFRLRQQYYDSIVFLLLVLLGELTNACLRRIDFNSTVLPFFRSDTLCKESRVHLWVLIFVYGVLELNGIGARLFSC